MKLLFSIVPVVIVALISLLILSLTWVSARRASTPRRPKLLHTNLRASTACLLLLSLGVLTMAGCTAQQKQTTLQVVTQINAQMPAVIAAGDTIAATVAALAPADAALINVGDVAFDAAARTLQSLTASYVANPTASVLAQIQTAINTLEANLNTATLNAVGIKDTTSQQLALASLKGLLTIVTVVFGMISSTESVAQLYRLRETNTIHLARVRPYMDEHELQVASRDAGVDLDQEFAQAAAHGF